jgi:hypothetical protein
VETTAGRKVVGQVIRLSDMSLEIVSRGVPVRLDESQVGRIRLRDPIDGARVKSGAWLGLFAALACASSSKCRPWETGDFSVGGMLGFLGFCGAGAAAGAIAAATFDALHTPTLYVAPRRTGPAIAPAARVSRDGLAFNVVLRF